MPETMVIDILSLIAYIDLLNSMKYKGSQCKVENLQHNHNISCFSCKHNIEGCPESTQSMIKGAQNNTLFLSSIPCSRKCGICSNHRRIDGGQAAHRHK